MQLLTVEQAAEKLGTTIRFIRRLTAEGRIPYHECEHCHIRISDEDRDAYIAPAASKPRPHTPEVRRALLGA